MSKHTIPDRMRRPGRIALVKTKWTLAVLALALFLPRGRGQDGPSMPPVTEPVGRSGAGRTVTPVNQITTPAGQQLDLPGLRPQALALSPDGKLLAVSGKSHQVGRGVPWTGGI